MQCGWRSCERRPRARAPGDRGRDGSVASTGPRQGQPARPRPEDARGQCPEPRRGHARQHSDFELSTSRTVTEYISVVHSTLQCCPRKLTPCVRAAFQFTLERAKLTKAREQAVPDPSCGNSLPPRSGRPAGLRARLLPESPLRRSPPPPGHARPSASSGRPAPRPSASTKRPPSCSTPPRLVLDPLPLVARHLSPSVPCNLPASCPDASPLPAGCQATLKSHFRSSHLF